jgi:hypothetical protein
MPFEPKIYHQNSSDGRCESAEVPAHLDGSELPDEPVWDDAEALELPDDLACLADQLRDDAVYLAQRHPADATHQQRELVWEQFVADEQKAAKATTKLPAGHATYWRWISAAAALAVFAVGSAWAFHLLDWQRPGGNSIAVTDVPVAEVRPRLVAPPAAGVMPAQRIQTDEIELPTENSRLIPAALLRDVSAPELDGMLDLLEQDESGISI